LTSEKGVLQKRDRDKNKKRVDGAVSDGESEGGEDEEKDISMFVPHHT
jgi:hypothetical protein